MAAFAATAMAINLGVQVYSNGNAGIIGGAAATQDNISITEKIYDCFVKLFNDDSKKTCTE